MVFTAAKIKFTFKGLFSEKISEALTQRCSVKKGVLINFVKFTGKHLYRSHF